MLNVKKMIQVIESKNNLYTSDFESDKEDIYPLVVWNRRRRSDSESNNNGRKGNRHF